MWGEIFAFHIWLHLYVGELRLTSGEGSYLRDDSGQGITPSKGHVLHWPTAPVSHKPVLSPTNIYHVVTWIYAVITKIYHAVVDNHVVITSMYIAVTNDDAVIDELCVIRVP